VQEDVTNHGLLFLGKRGAGGQSKQYVKRGREQRRHREDTTIRGVGVEDEKTKRQPKERKEKSSEDGGDPGLGKRAMEIKKCALWQKKSNEGKLKKHNVREDRRPPHKKNALSNKRHSRKTKEKKKGSTIKTSQKCNSN